MGYSINNKWVHLDMCFTEFDCPWCKYRYTSEWYEMQLNNSKRGLIYKICKICKKKIGISTDIIGDVVVWLKETEPKPTTQSNSTPLKTVSYGKIKNKMV